jgi:transcriptional regulator with XRE-family HTH domain
MNQGKVPLVEGESPLDSLLQILGMTQAEFCVYMGISPSTPSRWKGIAGKPPTEAKFSIVQLKRLSVLLDNKGLSVEDLPDSFAPYKREGTQISA